MGPSGSSPPRREHEGMSGAVLSRTLTASPPPIDEEQGPGKPVDNDGRKSDKGKGKAVDSAADTITTPVDEAAQSTILSRPQSGASGHLAPPGSHLSTPVDTPRRSTSSISTGAHIHASTSRGSATRPTTRKAHSGSKHTSKSTSDAGSRNASRNGSRSSRGGTPAPRSPSARSPSPRFPTAPTTAAPTDVERKRIASQITKKRSRKFLPHRSASPSDSDREGDTWTHEDIAHAQLKDREACMALRSKHVELIIDGRAVHTEAELGDATVPGRKYVWEVMYENQRGFTLFGKSWYSSNSLLPSDPTPFTLPSNLPETEVTEAQPPQENTRVKRARPKRVRDSINTAYTLESYETPSPAWVWLTPWMVNMRSKTDEQGWEYNLWFHRTSWRSHPGHLNWWGWVRRRQWVRLRGLVPEIIEKANEEVREAADDFWGRSHHHGHSSRSSSSRSDSGIPSRHASPRPPLDSTPLDQRWDQGDEANKYLVRDIKADDNGENNVNSVRTSTTTNASESSAGTIDPRDIALDHFFEMSHPVLEMVRALALCPLDREKLATLIKWSDEATEEDKEELKRLLQDTENLESLARAFIFPLSRNDMFVELTKRNIIPKRVCNDCLTTSPEE